MISVDAFKVSWLYQEGVADGKAEGKQEGKAEGKVEALQSSLRRMLARKFPEEKFPEIDKVSDPEALDRLFTAALDAQGPQDVRDACLAVVRPH